MAINKNLLSPSSASSSAIVAKTIKTSALSSVKSIKSDVGNLKDNKSSLRDLLVSINEKVIKIDKVLKKTTILQNKDYQKKLRDQRTERSKERERKLEEKKKEDKKQKPDEKKIPGLGFLDRIKRFLFFTFLGWLTNKYWDKIPAILEFTKKLTPIIGVIETIGGAIFNGVVNFIDTGYKVYDGLRDFTKQIGGENFQKKFDDFSKNLNTFINIAIIAGMATMGGTDFGMGGKPRGGRPGRGGRVGSGSYGNSLGWERAKKGRYGDKGGHLGVEKDIRERYAKRYGRDAAIKKFGRDGVRSLGGKYGRSAGTNLARKGAVALLGKGGAKAILGTVRPLLKRLPIIGALIDFGLSVALGEPLGRAAFKSIGAGLLGAIGTGLGGPLGAIIGGFAGDWAGGKLYDIFFGGERNVDDKSKPKKKARGGVTRGGKEVSGNIGRTLKVKRTLRKTLVPPKPTKITPGIDVGGENKIKTMFPEPDPGQFGLYQNSFGFLMDSTELVGNVPYLGPLFSLFGKLLLGQSPKSADYKIISLGLTAWINNAITQNLLNGNNVEKMLREMPLWIESSVKKLVDGVAIQILNGLKENLLLKPLRELFSSSSLPPGELGDASDLVGGTKLLMDAGFPVKGAAYLSGNIQQESGWKGQRDPWVLNDGAGTNKGLVSWNRGRIVNAEKFLGKALNQATNAEQVKWIKHEMEKSYPEAYRIFMNPGASDAELERASYIYLGYGEVGARFKYAKEALKRLEKGETGTYNSPNLSMDKKSGWDPRKPGFFNAIEYITGDKNYTSNYDLRGHGMPSNYHDHIAFKSISDKERAKKALRLAGIRIGSELRPGDRGYHGLNLAIDIPGYQWGGSGVIGKKEFEGSKKVREVLGLKDGGVVGPNKPKNIKPIESQASYEDGYTILIQPIIIEKPVPVGKKTINFSGGGSVNTNNDKSSLFIR